MLLCYDLESTGLSPYGSFQELGYWPARPFAFAFRAEDGRELYFRFDVDPMTREVLYQNKPSDFKALKELLECPGLELVGHNISFDLTLTAVIGINFKGKFWDTRILSHCADSSRSTFALKPLCQQLFDIGDEDQKDLLDTVKKARRLGKKLGWKLADDVKADFAYGDPELCKKYALRDVERTLRLFKFYEPLLNGTFPEDSPYHKYRELVEMEHALVPIVMEMSREGACIDMSKVAELEAYYLDCMEKAKQARIEAGYADLNPKSPQQVIDVFYNQLGAEKQFKTRKDKKTGKRSKTLTVDKKVLAGLSNSVPLAQHLLEYSEAQKQYTGFILPFKENSFMENGERVIHPSYNTVGPISGRMSCSNPNLQNITSADSAGKLSNVQFRVRECFVPPKDHIWLLADYSQIEVVVTAYLSKDPVMMEALETGKKLHDITCVDVMKGVPGEPDWEAKRKKAKITNFLLQYRGGAGQLAQTLGIPYEEALTITKRYWETYQGLDAFYKRLEKEYKKNGFVKSLFGRSFRVRFESESYKLGNYVSQGTAAEIIKKATIALNTFLKAKFHRSKLILTVHDELIQKTPKELLCDELVEGTVVSMQGNFHELLGIPHPLPVEVSIARENWGKKEKYSLKT